MGKKITIGNIFFIALFLTFWLRGAIYLDPDFGYRVTTGKLIIADGFPATDPYSYSMPSFPYVEHAWLIAVLWGYLTPLIGLTGLSLISAVLSLGALTISESRAKVKLLPKKLKLLKNWGEGSVYLSSFVFLLGAATLLPFSGVRAQVFSWFITSVLLFVLFDTRGKKYFILLPLLFLLWVNLHGSFIAGLGILFLVVLIKGLRKKKFTKADFSVLFLSFASTFVSPYGFGAWRESLSSVLDTSLRWQISEWMPALLMIDLSFISLLVFSSLMVYRFRKKLKLEERALFWAVLMAALFSRRHIPLWVLVALPMSVTSLNHFYDEVKGIKQALPRLRKVYRYAWWGSLILLLSQSFFSIRAAYFLSEKKFYPKDALVYLKGNLPEGRLFSEYGWGGYLTLKLPEKKVFIDGRMPSWRFKESPSEELVSAFETYNKLLGGEVDYTSVFDRFGIEVVVWPKNQRLSAIDLLAKRVENLLSKEAFDYDLIEKLEDGGWNKVYEDDVSVIYQAYK